MNGLKHLSAVVVVAGTLSVGSVLAAQKTSSGPAAAKLADEGAAVAVANIENAGNYHDKITGTVTFTESGDGVKIVADVDGLPAGEHGFHIHQKPDLTAPDLSSAGGHYNPDGHHHGGPDAAEHHLGDLGNLVADDKGHAHLEITVSGLTVSGEKNPVVGHSVIIHAKPDDLKTDPSGNSGARIAGGAILVQKGSGK